MISLDSFVMCVVFWLFLLGEFGSFEFFDPAWISMRNFCSVKVRKNLQPRIDSLAFGGRGVYFLGKTLAKSSRVHSRNGSLAHCPETSAKTGKQGTNVFLFFAISIAVGLSISGIGKYIFEHTEDFPGEGLMYVIFWLLFMWRELDCLEF